MDKTQRQQVVIDLIATLVTTFLILLIWWIAELPEWKRQALIAQVTDRVKPRKYEPLSPMELLDVAQFKVRVSEYSHGDREE